MEKSLEERIDELEERNFAHGMVLKIYGKLVEPDLAKRIRLREAVCDGVEKLYADKGLIVDHERLQRVLVEVEALFDAPTPGGRRTP